MAIFSTKYAAVKRSQGKNAVASAAYISRSKLTYCGTNVQTDKNVKQIFNYTPDNAELIHSEILAPAGSPSWVYNREKLWNKCEEIEKRKDAWTAYKYMFALPKELTLEQNIELAREFAKDYMVSQGMVIDMAVHFDKENNPHVHYQMSTRKLEGEEFAAKKTRIWGKTPFIRQLNKGVADTINKHLELYGHLDRVSHLSFKDRGIDLEPGVHEGPGRYIKNSELTAKNKKILEENARAIRENPELVFDKLSINKPVFTKEDIAKVLNAAISTGLINTTDITNIKGDIEELNTLLQQEFLNAYATVMASDKLTLIVEEDLKGRTLYALTKRLELESRFEQAVHELSQNLSHKLEYKGNEDSKSNQNGRENNKDTNSQNLSAEQTTAVKEILQGNNISILEGLPGAGKTTVMREIVACYRAAGKRVLGAAPSSVAALNLASVTGIEAKNLAQWRKIWQEAAGQKFELHLRADYYKQEQYGHGQSSLTPNDIIIIDEAGMVELSSMDYMLHQAKLAGAKVILVGDNNQL